MYVPKKYVSNYFTVVSIELQIQKQKMYIKWKGKELTIVHWVYFAQ